MLRLFAVALLLLTAAGASAQCLDYDTVLPLVAALPEAGEIIAADTWQTWLFALEKTTDSGRQLQIYDVSDPTTPQLVTKFGGPSRGSQLVCRDGFLYILTQSSDNGSVMVYDVQSPAAPEFVGGLTFEEDIYDFDVEGDVLVVAAKTSGLLVVDATDPAAMSVIGSYTPPAGQGDGSCVDLRGDRVLLGLGTYFPDEGHVHWLDLSDPASPAPLGDVSSAKRVIEAHLLGDESRALVTSESSMALVDLSSPDAPTIGPWRVAAGEHLIVAGDLVLQCNRATGAAMLVDIADPAAPRWLAPRERIILDAVAIESWLVLARGTDGLAVAALTGPEAAPIVGVEDADAGSALLVATGDPDIVLGLRQIDTTHDVQIFDVSDPAAPRLRSIFAVNSPRAAAAQGHQAMVLTTDECHLLDLTDPDLPHLVATWTPPVGAINLLWIGDLLYVAANSNGLVVMDASNPALPVELGRIDPPGAVRNVLSYDASTLLLACHSAGLKVADVSDPAAPALIAEISTEVYAETLAVSGSRCFVGGFFDSDLVEVDLSDPASPKIAGTTQVTGGVGRLRVHQGQLWILGASAINVLDLSAPGSLALAGRIGFFSFVGGLVPAGEFMTTSCGYVMVIRPPCSPLTAVDESTATTFDTRLLISPNPANPRTTIAFAIAVGGPSRLDIFDIVGRRVRTPWQGTLAAGDHVFTWDGRDDTGRLLASGTYLARLVASNVARTAKVSLVR